MSEEYRCFMYHPKEAPEGRIFTKPELEDLDDDWVDSPALLGKKREEKKVKSVDMAKSIDDMDKAELTVYAKRELGVDLDQRKKLDTLLDQVKTAIIAKANNG